jgi:alanine racemase
LGFAARILVLGYVPPRDAERVVDLDVAVAVAQGDVVAALAQSAAARDVTVAVHVKMDVGMYRAGASEGAAITLAATVRDAASLRLEGFCAHFPSADEPDGDDTEQRFARFVRAAEVVAAPIRHVANTATLLRFPQMSLEMVRPGAGLYGIAPGVTAPAAAHGLRAVMAWKTSVVQVHDVPAGASVSYGGTWTAARASRVAVVAVGYSDGYRRALSNRGAMLVRGYRAPVVGVVCMDMCLLDVTDGPEVRVGDVVVVVGRDGSSEISLVGYADALGTIPYEVCTSLGGRMPRVYFRAGAAVLIQTVLDAAPRALTAAEAPVVGGG